MDLAGKNIFLFGVSAGIAKTGTNHFLQYKKRDMRNFAKRFRYSNFAENFQSIMSPWTFFDVKMTLFTAKNHFFIFFSKNDQKS